MFLKIYSQEITNARPQACNFIKKEILAQLFSCEFYEISKNIFFTEHLWTTALEYVIIANFEQTYFQYLKTDFYVGFVNMAN